MVNFDGPIVFCVVSRYHGGAFVVFSATLNDNMEVAAVEGSYASVIGGAPAAAVVFAGEVNKRTAADPRVAELEARDRRGRRATARSPRPARLRAELAPVRPAVRSEKLGEVADEFDTAHSVQRARRMGSVHTIVPAVRLRPYLVDAVQRGMARTLRPRGRHDRIGGVDHDRPVERIQRVAIVTGGARGIGAAITTALARSGVHVAAGYSRNAKAADELAGKLNAEGALGVGAPGQRRRARGLPAGGRGGARASAAGSTTWSTTPASPWTRRCAR